MQAEVCSSCRTRVVPKQDGTCPSCGQLFSSSPESEVVPAALAQSSSGSTKQEATSGTGNKSKTGLTLAAILVGLMFGLVYYVAYALVFIVVLGIQSKEVGQVAQFVCLGLGIFTAFKLMLTSGSKDKVSRSESAPDATSDSTTGPA